MNMREYIEIFRYLMDETCLLQEDIVFAENIAEWCRAQGIPEPDMERPFKLVSKDGRGCRMLIREETPERVIDERINAMRIRNQLRSVSEDRGDRLNSIHKKLAFLFLNEYASSLPEIGGNELLADDWAFKEMGRLGYFKS